MLTKIGLKICNTRVSDLFFLGGGGGGVGRGNTRCFDGNCRKKIITYIFQNQ